MTTIDRLVITFLFVTLLATLAFHGEALQQKTNERLEQIEQLLYRMESFDNGSGGAIIWEPDDYAINDDDSIILIPTVIDSDNGSITLEAQ